MKTLIESTHPSSDSPPPPRANTLALLGGLLALSALASAPAWAAAEPITPCTAEPTNMTISPGDLVDCTIGVKGDSDQFRFEGVANSLVVVSLLNKGYLNMDCADEGKCPEADVVKPDGSLLISFGVGNYGDSQLVTLPTSGTYTIRVRDNGNDNTFSYRVGLERLFPTSPTAVNTEIGLVHNNAIDPLLDQDIYTFQGAKDAQVGINLGTVSGQLFAPDQSLVSTWDWNGGYQQMTLPQTGAYALHIFSVWGTSKISYLLESTCLAPAPNSRDCKGTPIDEPPLTCNGLEPTLQGTAKSEKLTGTPGDDVIVGLGGNDRISGLGGNDVICGNSDQATAGSDTLLGGEGNDTLIGSGMLLGEAGNDSLKGGNARDSLLGGPDDDTLDAQGGDDLAIGGAGNDKLLGGAGANDLCDKDANDLTPATGCEIRFTP